ncbi:hypothetical protein AGDE_11086 [Angomonas deanei]|nr:hypothetical protein AGDE_11086 [Angomonas deanei]|eukprot:EPY26798.1 hypothetical protein AGDE_11086 [Angomonas deanei]
MFCCTLRTFCFAQLAASSAARFKEEFASPEDGGSVQLWIDDTEEERVRQENHIKSLEYRELHKPPMTTSAMGLFGGEPGFEKSHRVWVDPDRPQMKHIYNQSALAKNLRYTRYGYFKRDMHLLDIDKLIRHARMLPTPNRLLTDFLYQRVPLPDRSSAAFLRYQKDQLEMLEDWKRPASFGCAEEIFERLCVTNIPPVEVGVETHAEMIRCCAVCKEWRKGYTIYLTRAREVEEEDYTDNFVLDTNFFDAVLDLCVQCEKPQEGLEIMREVIERHLKPRGTMLDKALLLVSLAQEQLLQKVADHQDSGDATDQSEAKLLSQGMDLWALYDFFKINRTTRSFEAFIRMSAMLGKPQAALEAMRLAEASEVKVSLECYYWVLYAIRDVPHLSDFVMDLFGQLHPRGLTPDYLLFTMAFGFCALNADGDLAQALYSQHFIHTDINPTPEMVLFFCQACAQCSNPTVHMLSSCDALMDRLEETGSVKDNMVEIYDQYLELAATLGCGFLGV